MNMVAYNEKGMEIVFKTVGADRAEADVKKVAKTFDTVAAAINHAIKAQRAYDTAFKNLKIPTSTINSVKTFDDIVKTTVSNLEKYTANTKKANTNKGGFIDVSQVKMGARETEKAFETIKTVGKKFLDPVDRTNINKGGFLDVNQIKMGAKATEKAFETVKVAGKKFLDPSDKTNINKGGFIDLNLIKKDRIAMEKAFETTKVQGKKLLDQTKIPKESFLSMEEYTKRVQMFGKQIKLTSQQSEEILPAKQLKAEKQQFAGYALSLMFFGQQLQRMFTQVAKFGTTSFNEIAHSVEGVVTNTDMLQGSMKYLGFTIGEALEPFIAYIIPIVEQIANWVEENPKLTATIIAIGFALGALMAAGGGLKLAWDGFVGLNGVLGLFNTSVGAAATSLSAVLLPALLAIAAIWLLWETDLGKFRDFFVNTFGILWETVKEVFNHLWTIVKDILGIVVAIFKGDWDKVGKLTVDLLKNLAALFLKGWIAIAAVMINVLILGWNTAVDLILKVVAGLILEIKKLFIDAIIFIGQKLIDMFPKDSDNPLVSAMEWAIEKAEELKDSLSGTQDMLAGVADKIKVDYITTDTVKGAFDKVDATLGLSKSVDSISSEPAAAKQPSISINNMTVKLEDMTAAELLRAMQKEGADVRYSRGV